MSSVQRCELPAYALHKKYEEAGAYVDCYTTVIRGAVAHSRFVEAFYTTWLFKLERLVLLFALFKPSTDGDAHRLANGESNVFAAWSVEARAENQLLLCDFRSTTRSCLMSTLEDWDGDVVTRMYFGSVVVPRVDKNTGGRKLGFFFNVLMPMHKIYSRALLAAARNRIKRMQRVEMQ